jgi:hypothetical protein
MVDQEKYNIAFAPRYLKFSDCTFVSLPGNLSFLLNNFIENIICRFVDEEVNDENINKIQIELNKLDSLPFTLLDSCNSSIIVTSFVLNRSCLFEWSDQKSFAIGYVNTIGENFILDDNNKLIRIGKVSSECDVTKFNIFLYFKSIFKKVFSIK